MLGYLHVAGDRYARNIKRSELIALQRDYMYDEQYCKTCLALTVLISELEGEPASEELRISALFLRYSTSDKYDIKKTVNVVHEMFASPTVKRLIALQTGVREIEDKEAQILHDAEILTLFAQSPEKLIKKVVNSHGLSVEHAVRNLCNVAESQRMYTKTGAQMLKQAAPQICAHLGDYINALQSPTHNPAPCSGS